MSRHCRVKVVDQVDRAELILIGSSAVATIIGLVLAFSISHGVATPIIATTQLMTRMSSGDDWSSCRTPAGATK